MNIGCFWVTESSFGCLRDGCGWFRDGCGWLVVLVVTFSVYFDVIEFVSIQLIKLIIKKFNFKFGFSGRIYAIFY